ncbi:MAG: hypothetical protein AAGJ28_22440 [Pseudomonadota bacterium]
MKVFAVAVMVALLTACGSGPGPSGQAKGTQLTAEEVRSTFIELPWDGPSGTYFFKWDGTYTYESNKTTLTVGPLPYELTEEGVLQTDSTSFTFYRIGPGYRYYSSATDEFFVALPLK